MTRGAGRRRGGGSASFRPETKRTDGGDSVTVTAAEMADVTDVDVMTGWRDNDCYKERHRHCCSQAATGDRGARTAPGPPRAATRGGRARTAAHPTSKPWGGVTHQPGHQARLLRLLRSDTTPSRPPPPPPPPPSLPSPLQGKKVR